eukprot:g73473.t1
MLMCTYPLALFPVHEIIEQTLFPAPEVKAPARRMAPGFGLASPIISPRVFKPPTQIMTPGGLVDAARLKQSTPFVGWKQAISRLIVCISTGVVALVAGKKFAMLSTIGGSMAGVAAFVLPPLFATSFLGGWTTSRMTFQTKIVNLLIVVMGLIGSGGAFWKGVVGILHSDTEHTANVVVALVITEKKNDEKTKKRCRLHLSAALIDVLVVQA